jgi:hypothetical protein
MKNCNSEWIRLAEDTAQWRVASCCELSGKRSNFIKGRNILSNQTTDSFPRMTLLYGISKITQY